MLQGVNPFSRWEKELPKLIADPRYTAVGSLKERRLIFDDFCKTSADEHKRGKAERARKSREDFQALLEEAAIAGTLGEKSGASPSQDELRWWCRSTLEVSIDSRHFGSGNRKASGSGCIKDYLPY